MTVQEMIDKLKLLGKEWGFNTPVFVHTHDDWTWPTASVEFEYFDDMGANDFAGITILLPCWNEEEGMYDLEEIARIKETSEEEAIDMMGVESGD